MRIYLLILGMALATMIPRAIPALCMDRFRLSGKTEKFLKLIPYTAMTALIFPGILTNGQNIWSGLLVGGVAALCAYRRFPTVVVVMIAIAVNMLLQ